MMVYHSSTSSLNFQIDARVGWGLVNLKQSHRTIAVFVHTCILLNIKHLNSSQHKSSYNYPAFVPESIHSSPSVPSNDNETMHSPQAALWEKARQEELNSSRANAVWSEPTHLPTGDLYFATISLLLHQHGKIRLVQLLIKQLYV